MNLSEERLKRAIAEHLEALRRFATALTGNGYDGDDLAQGTIERLLDKGVPDDAVFAAWMYRVCRNLWIDQVRKNARMTTPGQDDLERRMDKLDGERAVMTMMRIGEIEAAMQKLEVDQREVLALVAIEECSYREAAEILDIPIGTVMSRVARARKRLLELS
ncbi:RNA polymerase sigma factor [Wenzhouxiangella sp. EGI_FJ10409]|uniref:RNA polymerase sigma factor n=1 Tax=Wenzhouxiangella sp. EGI_FJ10409 TaxID=3243767 RepID=UPI0035D7BE6A